MRRIITIAIGLTGFGVIWMLFWPAPDPRGSVGHRQAIADLCAARHKGSAGQAGELASVIDRDRHQLEQMMIGLGGKVASPIAKEGCS